MFPNITPTPLTTRQMSHMHQGVEILREVTMGQTFSNIVLAMAKGKPLL